MAREKSYPTLSLLDLLQAHTVLPKSIKGGLNKGGGPEDGKFFEN